jgi:hypothetical protein
VASTFEITTADWPRFRFAHSALWETMQAVRTLRRRPPNPLHRPWWERIDRRAVLERLPLLLAFNPPGPSWIPDFLAPPPDHEGLNSIEDELAVVAGYPPRSVRRDVQRCLAWQPSADRAAALQPIVDDPARGRRSIVAELRYAWHTLAEPFWPAVTRLVSDDISYRSRQLAKYGFGTMLAGLHPNITASASQLVVRQGEAVSVPLAGRGLLLIPSAFIAERPTVVHEPPWPPSLVYPARGVGNLWASPPAAPTALADLIGASRARLLLDLDEPRSTSVISIRHGLSPATTSAHLKRLSAAGGLAQRLPMPRAG